MILFEPTRAAAQAQWSEFLPTAGYYGANRNYVRRGHQNVSRISPWLQKRMLLEREVVGSLRAQWTFPAIEKIVQEVCWRTYWKGWLEQRPEAWARWRAAVPRLRADLNPEQRSVWEAACAGRTGISGFDDWSQELVATGYLHNHARMWFASIWIFTLRLPWELGAAFFYEYLFDGDAASNTLSWRWVAGLQTLGKTYLARAENIAKYTEGRCVPSLGKLAVIAHPITEEPLPRITTWIEDSLCSTHETLTGTGERVGLWLHAEDLAAEIGELTGRKYAAVNAAWPTRIATQAGWSKEVAKWTRSAIDDGAMRAEAHYQVQVERGATDDLSKQLLTWAREQNLRHVEAYRPFVGPWLEEGLAIERELRAAGITLTWRRRAWDSELFPYAGSGYFPFWERVKRGIQSSRSYER